MKNKLSWHNECLKNKKAWNESQIKYLKNMIEKLDIETNVTKKEIEFYEYQIKEAEKNNIESFDRDRFRVKRKKS